MPMYSYKCPSCEKVSDQFHGMTEEPKIKCKDCKKVLVRQIIMFNTTRMPTGAGRKMGKRK